MFEVEKTCTENEVKKAYRKVNTMSLPVRMDVDNISLHSRCTLTRSAY